MKLRNQLLALFCLLLFAAFGFFYIRLWVVQKPFGIILFVSDGMVVSHLSAARLYQGGGAEKLGMDGFPHLALVRNTALDYAVPDSASAATALSTGTKVNHRNVATAPDGTALKTLLELARAQGRSVGLVTTGLLADSTPGAFYAHVADSRDRDRIASQFVDNAALDVALGGGAADFTPEATGGRRKDGRDLIAELRDKKRCEVVKTKAELERTDTFRSKTLVGFFGPDGLAYSNKLESGSQQPSLTDMVRRAVEILQANYKGYVLVVDASLCSQATEGNLGEQALIETLALDTAITTAAKYAGASSLIVAVGKHAIGGLTLNGYPPRGDHGVALIGGTAAGYPSLTWNTGPNGPQAKTEPSAFQTPSALNTAEDVVAIGRGDGSEKLSGFMENTAIFEIIREAL